MMVQSTVEFLIHNNVAIIQGGFAVIFLLAVTVILKSFKEEKATATVGARTPRPKETKKEEPVAASPMDDKNPLDDLDNLDDLIGPTDEKTPVPTPMGIQGAVAAATAAAAAGTPAEHAPTQTAAPSAELQKAVEEKEKVINDMKAEMTQLQEKLKAGGDTKALEDKIKELTEKLSEYEIIEDDIANLSFYKSENTKLKNELDKIKGIVPAMDAAPAPEAPAAPTPVAAMPTPAPVTSAPVDNAVLEEFEKAVQQKEAIEKVVPEDAGTKVSVPKDADLMKEFESLVEKDMAASTQVAAAPTSAPKPEPAAATPAPKAEPAGATVTDIDSQKLVQEMEKLATTPAPAAVDDGKDSTQKLIEEFENFMNKASS